VKLVRCAALALLFAAAAGAAEVWYEAYDAALKAIAAQQWPVAEIRLKSAIKEGPRPGRRVRTYGMQFIDYVPGYQLGLVYSRQQRHAEALEELRKVAASGLYADADPEAKAIAQMIQAAEAAVAPRTAKVDPPKPTAEPSPRATEAAVEPARATLPSRPSDPPPAPSAIPIQKSAEPRVAVVTPAMRPTPESRASTARPTDDRRQQALRAFFGGDYETSQRLLDGLAAGAAPTAETLFYLGASYAAQSFMSDTQRDQLQRQAKLRFAEARRKNPAFRADPRLVSPRILRLFEQSGS